VKESSVRTGGWGYLKNWKGRRGHGLKEIKRWVREGVM